MAPYRAAVQLGFLPEHPFASCRAALQLVRLPVQVHDGNFSTWVVTENQLYQVGPPQVQSFLFPFIEPHEVPACLFLKPIQVPLNGSTIIRSINVSSCITYKILHLALLIYY